MEHEREHQEREEEVSPRGPLLGRPDVPQATRLSRLALVVAAAVMSVTLLVVALMVTSSPEHEPARPLRMQPLNRGASPEFMTETSSSFGGSQTTSGGAAATPLRGDSAREQTALRFERGEESATEGSGRSGGYATGRYTPPASYRPRGAAGAAQQVSPEQQALERALRAGLRVRDIDVGRPQARVRGEGLGAEDPPEGSASADYLRAYAASARQAAGVPSIDPATGGKQNARFSPTGSNYIATGMQYPNGRYEIREGTLIEAFLVTGIHSDLPGEVIAQVARNVYDSQTQQVLIIPRGTRMIGTYDNQVALDQSRLLVAWNRMVLPDGRSLNLPGLNSKDPGGRAGLPGAVNRHYWRAFGNAMMLSVVGTGLAVSASRGGGYRGGLGYPSPGEIAASSVATELSRVATELLRRDLSRRPTIEIREGMAFNIFMNGDLALEPYEPYDGFLRSSGRRGGETAEPMRGSGYVSTP